ncbi:MAG: murein biosynthesis integral membrane protein MurJ [Candidatus Celaenobacter polaris]|nr:murein biosynthesis integral membrane protein MurJ [Candidatus Celaenobacter polaris]
MSRSKENLTRDVGKISSGTFLSRISGLVRDIFLTHFLGVTAIADSFGVAFVIPNMLRGLFGEGSLAAAFIPTYTEIKETRSKEEAVAFALNLLSILVLILIGLVLLGLLLAPYIIRIMAPGFSAEVQELTIHLTRILFPYLFLIGLTSSIIAILNAHKIFFFPSLSPLMLNLGIILPILFVSFFTHTDIVYRAYLFSGGVILGGIFQLFVNVRLLKTIGYTYKFKINFKQKELKGVWNRMIPGILSLGIREVNVVVDTLLASLLITGSVAALQYGNRLMQLPLGVFGVAIGAAVLPMFSRQTAHKKADELIHSIQEAFQMIIIIMMPIIVLILVVGKDAISLVFLHGAFDQQALIMTYSALTFYSIGLISHSSVKIFASAFFALKNTKTPMIIAGIAVICNIILNLILMRLLQLRGLALATSIAATLQATILFFTLQVKIGRISFRKIGMTFIKVVVLSVIVGLVAYDLNMFSNIYLPTARVYVFIKLLIIFAVSMMIYLFGLKLYNVTDLKKIRQSIFKTK